MTRRVAPIAAVAAACAGVTALVDGTAWMPLWWVVAPGLAVAAVIAGLRRIRRGHRRPWVVLAVSLTMLWVGWTMSAAFAGGYVPGRWGQPLAYVQDAIYLVAYPGLGVASLMMVRARTGGRDRDNLIDASLVMVALATVMGAWLFGRSFTDGISDLDRAWVSLAPLLLAAVVTCSVRILFAAGTRLLSAWLMLAGGVFTLLGNLWTAKQVRDGVASHLVGIDVLWILGFVCVAAAALDRSRHALTEPVPSSVLLRGMPVDRLALLAAALVAAPLTQLLVAPDRPATVPVVAGGVLVAVLAVWRVARLLQERDAARRAVTDVARRDAAVATVGRWALDDRSIWQLLSDTDELLEEALPGTTCAVVPVGLPAPPAGPDAAVERFPVEGGGEHLADIVAVTAAGAAPTSAVHGFLASVASLLSAAAGRRVAEAQLRHDALHDALTGLPNRTLAVDRLVQLLSGRDVRDVTVVFLDLDGFKAVNDLGGHDAGDALLRDVAGRLRAAVRPEDTVARFAGDEFVVVLHDTDRETAERLVERLVDAATTTVRVADEPLTVRASAGIASTGADRGEHHSIDATTLLARADVAMYRAKRAGGGAATWDDDGGDSRWRPERTAS